jgi:glutamate racemase
MSSRAVGFFDSGLGGLCILEAFKRECPSESTVYIADSANCPYGNRSAEEIIALSDANARRLLEAGCKMIVVACNTASAAALEFLREKYPDVPFVGIEPAIKPAAMESRTGIVGVLATAGTFGGRLYNETKAKFAKNATVIATVADEFVDLVERGLTSGEEAERIVRKKIEPLIAAGCDRIVLGCTHFPHLKPLIEKVAEGRADVVEPSRAVALRAKSVLEARNLANRDAGEPKHVFISSRKGEPG